MDKNSLKQLLKPASSVVKNTEAPYLKKSNRKIATESVIKLCEKGFNLDQIGEALNISRLSSGILVERVLKKGNKFPLEQFVLPSRIVEIEFALKNLPLSSIKKVSAHFKDKIPEEEIRVVRGNLIAHYNSDL